MKILTNLIRVFFGAMLVLGSTVSQSQSLIASRETSRQNRVAILPITYIGEGSDTKMEEMRFRLQDLAYEYLIEDAMALRFQQPAETNALLHRNGISSSRLHDYSPRELAYILGVEYVVFGLVSQEADGLHTFTNSTQVSRNRNRYDNQHHCHHRHDHDRKIIKHYSTHTTTRESVNTSVDIIVYNDQGEKVYSKSRRSILTTMDAYRNCMHYLLKRTPLYRK